MATPVKHAVLSASSSNRWLHCTAAPRFEENFPDGGSSVYAEEGTLAHAICEITAKLKFGGMTKRKYNAELRKLKDHELFKEEMLKTAEFYAEYLNEKSMAYADAPYVAQEVSVDFSSIVPEGFGTCDCIMIGGDTLQITDYKHGKGVEVSAENNSQMRLYAYGALSRYQMLYPGIEYVNMAIVQPRITEDVSEEKITVHELMQWAEEIKPIAQKAFDGNGEFAPGAWCRFCKGRAQCKARAENYTALEEFKDVAKMVGKPQGILTDEEVADLLKRGEELSNWYEDLKNYALEAILAGKDLPGWKVVAGRSARAFSDTDAAFTAAIAAGIDEAMLYERKPKTLAGIEKMLGKKDFESMLGVYVTKPMGKPTLTTASDKREAYSPAAADFAGVKD